jgi:hypothetical protein
MYYAKGANQSHLKHRDILLSGVFSLLDTAKPPIKESALIIVGSLGKYVLFRLPAPMFVNCFILGQPT